MSAELFHIFTPVSPVLLKVLVLPSKGSFSDVFPATIHLRRVSAKHLEPMSLLTDTMQK